MREKDQTLVKRVLAGDRGAFADLLERYTPLVHGVILEKIRRPDEVEDLVQETFVQAYQKLASLREPAKFGPWIARIAGNMALEWFQRGQRRLSAEHQAQTLNLYIPPPDELFEDREHRAIIWEALDRLPPEYRRIVVLYHLEGCTQADIARFMNIAVATVKWRLYRARSRLHLDLVHLFGQAVGHRSSDKQRMQEKVLSVLPILPFFKPPPSVGWLGTWMRRGLISLGCVGILGLSGLVVQEYRHLQEDEDTINGATSGFRVRREQVELPEISVLWEPGRPQAGDQVRVEATGIETNEGQKVELHFITNPLYPLNQVVSMRQKEEVWEAEIQVPQDAAIVFFYVAPFEEEGQDLEGFPHEARKKSLQRYNRHFSVHDKRGKPVKGAAYTLAQMVEFQERTYSAPRKSRGGKGDILTYLDREIALYPEHFEVYRRRWSLMWERWERAGDRTGKEEVLSRIKAEQEELRKRFPEHPELHFEIARFAPRLSFTRPGKHGDEEERIKAYRAVYEHFPDCEHADDAAFIEAKFYQEKGDRKGQIEQLTQFIHSFPQSPYQYQAYSSLLHALLRVDKERAIRLADSLIARQRIVPYDPDYKKDLTFSHRVGIEHFPEGLAYSMRFDLFLKRGDVEGALNLADRLRAANLQDPFPYRYIGARLMGKQIQSFLIGGVEYPQNLTLATEVLEAGMKAVQIDNLVGLPSLWNVRWSFDKPPESWPGDRQRPEYQRRIYLETLSECYLQTGHYHKAIAVLQEVIGLQKKKTYSLSTDIKAETYVLLGRAREQLEQWKEAEEAYKQALILAYSHPQAEEALRRIHRQQYGNTDLQSLFQTFYTEAPDITLFDVYGEKVGLAQYRDKVVLLYYVYNYRSSPNEDRSGPGIKDMVQAWQREFGEHGLEILYFPGYNADATKVRSLAEKQRPSFRFLLDDGRVCQAYNISSDINLFLIDRQGHLRLRKDEHDTPNLGSSLERDHTQITEKIKELLRENTTADRKMTLQNGHP